ncbi:MAG: DNA primase [Marinagarivorans sp.]|nr:DNA primase [Marinagarivorans sp.]
MSLIPQNFIDDLLNRIDIVDIIDKRVKLKKTGKNYSACCPFHNEKSPSFTVSQDKQFYYCFGCGVTGNAVGFLMEFDKVNFVDAVESLAHLAGMQVPKDETPQKRTVVKQDYKTLYQLMSDCSDFYAEQLKSHPERDKSVQYLRERGLTGQIAKAFRMGYAPQGWDNLLLKFGVDDMGRKALIESGMLIVSDDGAKQYDRFRNRIMFPILDVRGRVIGFGGRVLGEENRIGADGKKLKGSGPKYLNSPETPIFHKGKELYGLYQARQANRELKHLLVVEGYMDVIALAQYGISNAVATLGTACGEDHLTLAFKYTNTIVFCFDGDKAGRTAAKRALENALPIMTDGYQIKFLFLAEGQDPDSLVRQIGQERFNDLIEKASPLEEFFFNVLGEGLNVMTMEGRARMSKLAAPLLHQLPKSVYRELMFELLAQRTGLSHDILQELIAEPIPRLVVESDIEKAPPAPLKIPAIGAPVKKIFTEMKMPEPVSTEAWPESALPNSDFKSARRALPRSGGHGKAVMTKGRVQLNPVSLAMALLLERPELAHLLDEIDLPNTPTNQPIHQLFDYLKRRDNTTFASVIGYWGGRFGAAAQQELVALVANDLLLHAKRGNQYDDLTELKDALAKLRLQADERKRRQDLADLQSKPATEFSAEEHKRYMELLRAGKQVH